MENKNYMNKMFNEHSPCVIFPNGLDISLVFVIAEGFIVRDGIFWFNVAWNYPLSGTGTAHHTKGKIKGPMISMLFKYKHFKGYKRYWQIGDAWVFEITKDFMESGGGLYHRAIESKIRSDKYKDDYHKSRKAAARIASKWLKG